MSEMQTVSGTCETATGVGPGPGETAHLSEAEAEKLLRGMGANSRPQPTLPQNCSPTYTKVYTALVAAKKKFKAIPENGEVRDRGGRLMYTYALPEDIRDAVEGALLDNGVFLNHDAIAHFEKNQIEVRTIATHCESGEWVRTAVYMPMGGDPQGRKSSITYGSRTSLLALLGLSPGGEDDDANRLMPNPDDRQVGRRQPPGQNQNGPNPNGPNPNGGQQQSGHQQTGQQPRADQRPQQEPQRRQDPAARETRSAAGSGNETRKPDTDPAGQGGRPDWLTDVKALDKAKADNWTTAERLHFLLESSFKFDLTKPEELALAAKCLTGLDASLTEESIRTGQPARTIDTVVDTMRGLVKNKFSRDDLISSFAATG